MGLFNLLMKGVGFETEEEVVDESMPKKLSRKERKALKKEEKRKKMMGGEYEDNFNSVSEGPVLMSPNSFAMNKDQFNTVTPENVESMGQTGYTQSFNPYGSYNQKNFVFFTPKSYEDVKKLIDYLKQTEPAIVNLDGITDEEAQRILDFISGGVCALNGSIQRIKGNIFLVAPDGFNIKMSRDQLEKK